MISPTGNGIRNDGAGSGEYDALRSGGRRHKGKDYLCAPGQGIYAPFDMVIDRVSYPYANDKQYLGIAWSTDEMRGRLWYFSPTIGLIGSYAKKGTFIGTAQDISKKYGAPMEPHVHFQINNFDPQILEDITKLVKILS